MSDDPILSSTRQPPPERRAIGLTDGIYSAAVTPRRWTKFLEAFSEELGGAAIAMSLQLPGTMAQPEYYRFRLSVEYVPVFERHFRRGLPWPMTDTLFREGFRRANTLFPDDRVHETEYYRDYMQPQGLAPEGPVAHVVFAEGDRPISGISIQRLEGHRHFDGDDLAMCDLIAPHLARAHAIRRQLKTSRRQEGVRTEVLDRIPTGIVMVDGNRRIVTANRAGELILGQRDGVQQDEGILNASRRANQGALNDFLDEILATEESGESAGGFLAIERPSGSRHYSIIASPLFHGGDGSEVGERGTAVFITDPENNLDRLRSSINTFQQMYDLTPAQTDVMLLLAEGRSLHEISTERGVTIHTTRSQLKQIFGKTNTSRQSELVRLALTGIAGVSND